MGALSCLIMLPAVLANDPPCTRCCNLESTVVVSALRLVQCEKGALDCPEDQNLVDDYLPEYMRCLIKNNKLASLVGCRSGGNDSDDDSEGSDEDSDASDDDS